MECKLRMLVFLSFISAGILGCGSDAPGNGDGGDGGKPDCTVDADCPGGGFCVNGECVECKIQVDCPEG